MTLKYRNITKNSGRKPSDCIWEMNPALGREGGGVRCGNAKFKNKVKQ